MSFRPIYLLPALICLWLLAACAPAVQGTPVEPMDPGQSIIFYNGTVLTMEADQPLAQAVAIRGDKIVAVGAEADVLAARTPASVMVDLGGRTLMPGFVDAHTHVLNDARGQDLSLDQAQALALRHGITTLGNLFVDPSFLKQIQAFEQAGYLRVRTSLYLVYNDPCGKALGPWWKAHPPTRDAGEMLRVGGIKIFTDGGSCGNVALSFDHAGQAHGDLWLEQDELTRMVAEVQAAGHQAAIHAIGDRAVEQAQDAIAFALDGQPNTYRHRIEHASVITPEMVKRFGQLGITPVVPGQYPSCTPFGPPLPEEYRAWEWPWRDLRELNPELNIAWHSDYPFWSINPFIHLYGFVTRRDVYNGYYTCQPAEWLKDDTLPVEQALSIMTIQSAYALFRDREVGSLAPGKYADVIILSGNPLAVPAEELRGLSVLATMLGGRFEHCDRRSPELCPNYAARTPAPPPDYRPPAPLRWIALIAVIGLPLGFGALRLWPAVAAKTLASLGGLAGAAGGGLWLLAGWLFGGDWATPWAWLPFAAAAGMALGTIGLASAGRPGRLGRAGLAIAVLGAISIGAGAILSEWFRLDAGWWAWIAGLMIHTLGLALFGLANLRARVLPRMNFLPLAVGLASGPIPLAASFLAGEEGDWPFMLVIAGLGLGWLALGGLVWAGSTKQSRERILRTDPG